MSGGKSQVYIMERIASAILWTERKRIEIDWSEFWMTVLLVIALGLLAVVGALIESLIRFGDNADVPWPAFRGMIIHWVVPVTVGALWVRLRIWSKIVSWAKRPERVAEALRKAQ